MSEQGKWNNPLTLFGTVVTALEALLTGAVVVWFPDAENRRLLVLVLLGMLMVTVLIVFYLVMRYPRELMAQFDRVTEAIVGQLSRFDREILVKMDTEGSIEYTEDTKDIYKPLRNQGLTRTRSGKAMRKDNVIVLTELGKLIVRELQQRKL